MTGPIVVVGAGGAQGRELVGYVRSGAPDADILAVDRQFSDTALARLEALSARTLRLDLLKDTAKVREAFEGARIIVNLAGPFYVLGAAVLDAAIAAGVPYLDICDDVDATETLLSRSQAAREAGCAAVIGMGSAPGTTNLLVKLALENLAHVEGEKSADIAWCAPDSDLTFGIFHHLVHCFKTALPGRNTVPDWSELGPRTVAFPEPVGDVEVVRLGHPEPLTLKTYLDCPTHLRGGMTSAGVLRHAWELARACDQGRPVADAWRELEASLGSADGGAPGLSGMVIDVMVGGEGIRFESATSISMEQSTAVPAAGVALMMLAGQGPGPGVWPPEALSPADFFEASHRVSPGGGGLRAFRLSHGQPTDRLSLRALFSPAAA